MTSPRDLVVVHTSDVHVDHDYTARAYGGDGARPLQMTFDVAREVGADIVLLCGDTFECHAIGVDLAERVRALIDKAPFQVVLLPGNHDPAVDDAIWLRGNLTTLGNLHILGVTDGEAVVFSELDLEVWGRPHRDYGDMVPLEHPPQWRAARRIAMAHGHYDPAPDRSQRPRPAWLIGEEEIAATAADYMALGHWNRAVRVGPPEARAYYSGSPDYARTVNIVRFRGGGVSVERHPIASPEGS